MFLTISEFLRQPQFNNPFHIYYNHPRSWSLRTHLLCTVSDTYSSLLNLSNASFMTASLPLCTMFDTYSSRQRIVGTSFMTANLVHLSTMPDTDSSFLNMVGTSFMTTSIGLCTMFDTYSPFLNLVGASFMTASLPLYLCTMSDTNSSLLNLVGTPLNRASSTSIFLLGTIRFSLPFSSRRELTVSVQISGSLVENVGLGEFRDKA